VWHRLQSVFLDNFKNIFDLSLIFLSWSFGRASSAQATRYFIVGTDYSAIGVLLNDQLKKSQMENYFFSPVSLYLIKPHRLKSVPHAMA